MDYIDIAANLVLVAARSATNAHLEATRAIDPGVTVRVEWKVGVWSVARSSQFSWRLLEGALASVQAVQVELPHFACIVSPACYAKEVLALEALRSGLALLCGGPNGVGLVTGIDRTFSYLIAAYGHDPVLRALGACGPALARFNQLYAPPRSLDFVNAFTAAVKQQQSGPRPRLR